MIYVISDTHFGHHNIIEYCKRPFASIEEMDQALVTNWKNTVKPEDTVIHFGDVSFKDRGHEYIKTLPGYKILLMGNHDKGSKSYFEFMGFHIATSELLMTIAGVRVLMRHLPADKKRDHWDVCFHGHTHNKDTEHKFNYNCCVEKHNYRPRLLHMMVKEWQKRQ